MASKTPSKIAACSYVKLTAKRKQMCALICIVVDNASLIFTRKHMQKQNARFEYQHLDFAISVNAATCV